ncbi:toxin co-regulated pilus biosynthesis Q family protein [Paraburkholderia sp. SARCC-3016]|uniref:toxin co-regulated pilus biosynthesis Q family protein n=1 Tax=Paraburkholderia sp. SARCC-3016 TaxID=3058611 RepID=UPI0028079D70|nr:toxin co-regulated pilus biosynthesis Q family protein [Paraburkholderia sp. SARCC-3016]MDQ7979846.1 toxin co-regulated pilus biosynthesis Q family protein [Paraburkholderia sp. SARCC-3016]
MQSHRRIRASVSALSALVLLFVSPMSHATLESKPTTGDGWQLLSQGTSGQAPPIKAEAASPGITAASSLAVAPVVLPGGPLSADQTLTLTITPQDINLRNALDRWLQTQGWQLAWKIDDDLPLEFNASFTGDFTSVLTQVMRATNHMRTPTRICRHTNNVIRVIARAANCKD